VKNIKQYISLPLLFLLLQCSREVTITLPEEAPKTVVVCHFKPENKFFVQLSRSQSVFSSNEFDILDSNECKATLSIDGLFWDRLKFKYDAESGEYFWVSRKTPLVGIPYTIAVQVPGNPLVEATSKVPNFFPIDQQKLSAGTPYTIPLPDGTFALRVPLEIKLQELPAQNRYFAFQLIHSTNVYRNIGGQVEFDYSYQANSSFTTDGRTLALLNDISAAEPVVLVNQNFWDADHSTIRLDAIIQYKSGTEKPSQLVIEWRTLSEEFYKYHLSLSRQGNNSPLNDPDAVFNHVKNGYGNFSGYSVSYDTLRL
jgi:Domain of unknown function (DUF4249)